MKLPGSKLLLLASFALAIPSAQAATTIFSHTFNNGTTSLNGQAVDGGTGSPQNWISAGVVTRNGVFATDQGSATLAFAPSNGFEYTLDARILNVTGDASWVALGFANGQSTAATNNRFIEGSVVGTAWSLFRGNNSVHANNSYRGNGTLGTGNHGLTSPGPWTALNNNGGSIDLRILLDTTDGNGAWTVTYLAKLIADSDYTTVRSSVAVPQANQANYTSVGFAFASNAVAGQLESFSLTAIPEPSAALLGGLGMLALLRRRR